jgi:hypothetical protein
MIGHVCRMAPGRAGGESSPSRMLYKRESKARQGEPRRHKTNMLNARCMIGMGTCYEYIHHRYPVYANSIPLYSAAIRDPTEEGVPGGVLGLGQPKFSLQSACLDKIIAATVNGCLDLPARLPASHDRCVLSLRSP